MLHKSLSIFIIIVEMDAMEKDIRIVEGSEKSKELDDGRDCAGDKFSVTELHRAIHIIKFWARKRNSCQDYLNGCSGDAVCDFDIKDNQQEQQIKNALMELQCEINGMSIYFVLILSLTILLICHNLSLVCDISVN